MKQLLSFLFVCAALSSAGQSSEVFTKHLRATERITLRSRSVTGINWTMLDADSLNNNVFPTAKSVNDFVRNLLNGYSGGGGGGGAADSSWVSTQTGVPFSTVGFLVNTTFPGASLPAGWVDQTPDASVTISNKLIVSGGNTNVSPVNGNQGTSTVYVNRLRVAHFPYDKLTCRLTVVPQDKSSSSRGLAIHFESNSLFFSTALQVEYNLSSTADSGKIILRYDFGSVVATSGNLSHAAGDTLDLLLQRDYWTIIAAVYNRRTTRQVDVVYTNPLALGTGGRMYLGLLGGSQHITRFQVESSNRVNFGYTLLGDSHTAGSGASSEEKSFASLLFRGNENMYSNLGHPSVTLAAMPVSHVPAAIALGNPVIIAAGYNDRRDLISDTNTYRQRLDSVVQPLRRAGLQVILATLVPAASGTNNNFNTVVVNLANSYNLQLIRVDEGLRISAGNVNLRANLVSDDGIHLSDSGHVVYANSVQAVLSAAISNLFNQQRRIRFYDVPTGYPTMAHLVLGNDGFVYQQPNRPFNGIVNMFNGNRNGTFAQVNSQIHVSSSVTSDSALQVHSPQGLRIGYNGGNLYAPGAVGSNINITNGGIEGQGFPQRFDDITGTGNVKIFASNLNRPQVVAIGSITGTSNLIINSHGNSVLSGNWNTMLNTTSRLLTSGSQNIFVGFAAGRLITTGSNNLHLWTSEEANPAFSSSLSNTVILGDFSGFSNTNFITPAAGLVSVSASANVKNDFWFGGPMGYSGVDFFIRSRILSTNLPGFNWQLHAGRGTGNAEPGLIVFRHSVPGSSGTALHSSYSNTLTLARQLITAHVQIDNSGSNRGQLPARWATAGRPASPGLGEFGYNTTDNKMEYWNGSTWIQW